MCWWNQIEIFGRARPIRRAAIRLSGSDKGRGPEKNSPRKRRQRQGEVAVEVDALSVAARACGDAVRVGDRHDPEIDLPRRRHRRKPVCDRNNFPTGDDSWGFAVGANGTYKGLTAFLYLTCINAN
jgi:hypothetical protein